MSDVPSPRNGDCGDFMSTARRAIAVEPDDYEAHTNLLSALMGQGAPREELTPVIDHAIATPFVVARAGDTDAASVRRSLEGSVAAWFGELGLTLRLEKDDAVPIRSWVEEGDAGARMYLLDEVGDRTAGVVAREYVDRHAVFTQGGGADGLVLRVLRRDAVLPPPDVLKMRDTWLREARARPKTSSRNLWIEYFAVPAVTRADAKEALAMEKALDDVRVDWLFLDERESLGRLFLLADKPLEAAAILETAATACNVITTTFEGLRLCDHLHALRARPRARSSQQHSRGMRCVRNSARAMGQCEAAQRDWG